MSLPDGVTTCLVTYGPITNTLGTPAESISVAIVADRTIVHGASGRTLFKNTETFTADQGGTVQIAVPHTNQSGFRDQQQNALTGWYYTLVLTARFPNGGQETDRKVFQPIVGQTLVDADLLPSDGMVTPGVTAPSAFVQSVNGQTGTVVVPTASDEAVAGYIGTGGTSASKTAVQGAVVPVIEAGVADPRSAGVAGLWELRRSLAANLTDVNVGHSADSVSTDIDEWFGLFWTYVAADFPTYTFIWHGKVDDGELEEGEAPHYAAPVTIQTGTGSHTVHIWNWAQSGAGAGSGMNETQAVFETAFPALDYLFISTAHNDDVETEVKLRDQQYGIRAGVLQVLSYFPDCQIIVTLINPKVQTEPRYTEGLMAQRGMVKIAGELGLNVMDCSRAFFDRGTYADLVPDGTHPNPVGSAFLAAEAKAQFDGARRPTVALRPRLRTESLFIPLLGGVARPGANTPTLELQDSYFQAIGVAFGASAEESWITPMREFDPLWNEIMWDVVYSPQDNSSGNVRLTLSYIYAPNYKPDYPYSQMSASPFFIGTVPVVGSNVGKNFDYTVKGSTSPNVLPDTQKTNRKAVGASLPFQIQVTRNADHADDTCAARVIIHGLRARRFR